MADDETIDLGIAGLGVATLIGRGGFAAVYRADQPDFRRTVAVKVLTAPEADAIARSRFERECQAMGALSEHPHIASLYDAGFLADGRAYLVMAYMEGGSLHELADRGEQPSWQEVATIGTKLAGALETAHRAGILHRDLKPANVLISAYGEPQLTDFGIARIAGGHETTSSHVTASLPYAPPEILDGAAPTPASDVYSLAATLVHLLVGSAPFSRDDDTGFAPLLRRVYEEEIPDLASHGAPPALDVVLRRAMAKDPARRQRSAEELGRQIQQAQRTLGAPVGEMVVAGAARDAAVDADVATIAGSTGVGGPATGTDDPAAGSGPQWWTPVAGVAPMPPPVSAPVPSAPVPSAPVPPPAPSIPVTGPPPVGTPPGPTPFAAPIPASGPAPAGGGSSNRLIFGAIAAAALAVVAIVAAVSLGGGDGEVVATTTPTPVDEAPTAEPDATPTAEQEPTPTSEPAAVPTAAPAPTVSPDPPPATVGGPIALGDSVSAGLAAGETAAYSFAGTAGDVIRFEVASPDGDPRISLLTTNAIPVSGADDCAVLASGTDALLVTELAVTGEYTVNIDFVSGGGNFTLTTLPGVTVAEGPIAFMQIRMRPSTDFQTVWAIADGDTSLVARSESGRIISADDDCFDDLDPRLEVFLADPLGRVTLAAYDAVPPLTTIGLFNIEGFGATATMPAATQAVFAIDLTAGQTVDVLMRSNDADAFLTVNDADDNVITTDDDSGGSLDAQLSFTAPADGRYRIGTSFVGDTAGGFSLGVLIT